MDPRTCGACGAELSIAARFCSQCGARLDRAGDRAGDQPGTAAADHGDRRQLTVMFCDLVESTALSDWYRQIGYLDAQREASRA
jgi:class 3 adenylate cyclase